MRVDYILVCTENAKSISINTGWNLEVSRALHSLAANPKKVVYPIYTVSLRI